MTGEGTAPPPASPPAAMDVAGKRVTVVGLGRFGGGVGVARWLCEQGARVTVSDKAPAADLARNAGVSGTTSKPCRAPTASRKRCVLSGSKVGSVRFDASSPRSSCSAGRLPP